MKRLAWSSAVLCIWSVCCAAALLTTPGIASAINFATHVDSPTGSYPYSVAVGDFNGDGKKDLVTTSATASTVSVLLGNGCGGFGDKTDIPTGSPSYSVAVGDFNGDSRQDLVTTNVWGRVSVLLGYGGGGFATYVDYPTGGSGFYTGGLYSVAVGDFNRDGKKDLVTANAWSDNVSVLLGNGSGSFATHVGYHTGSGPTSVAVADFNRDSKQDLVTVNSVANTVSVLLGNGYGSFATKKDFTTGECPYNVVAADFNGDGKQDLAVASHFGMGMDRDAVSVLVGNGNGTFAAKTGYPTGDTQGAIAVGDFNGDGKKDLGIANNEADTVSVLLGNGNGTFAAKRDFATGHGPNAVAVGDFNVDSRDDLAVASSDASTVSVLLNSDPVPTVNGNSDTAKPVLVLIAGLSSDTGHHMDGDHGWMNASNFLGDPWTYIGDPAKISPDKLGAFKVMVMPTAQNASHWSEDARAAGYVIDSLGHLNYNIKQLAAWLLERETSGEFGDHRIILIGHSYGGVIARSMLASNQLASSVRKKIKAVIQFGSPNGGTYAADFANAGNKTNLANLFAKSDATEDLAVGAMKKWNDEPTNRSRVGVPVVRFAGTYLPGAIKSMGWGWQRAWAQTYSDLHGGEDNDAIVASKSMETAYGELDDTGRDFGGGAFMEFPTLTHDQMFPGTDHTYDGVTYHVLVPQGSDALLLSPLKKAIANPSASSAELLGTGSGATAQMVSSQSGMLAVGLRGIGAPAVLPSVLLPERTVSISADGTARVTLPLDAPASIYASSAAGMPTVTVRDWVGAALECPSWSDLGADGITTSLLRVEPASSGEYTFDITLPPGISGAVTFVGIMGGGAQFTLSADESPYAGVPMSVTAQFESASGEPLLGATVSGTAELDAESDVTLAFRDDGTAGDDVADDGIYTARFTAPVRGRWVVQVEARHATAERAGNLIIDVGDALATVTGPLSEVTEPGPGATLASFGVGVPLHVSEAGTYVVCAALTDSAGGSIGSVQASCDLVADESTTLVATIDASQLSGIASGELTVAPLRISRIIDGIDLDVGSGPGLTTARSYAATDFRAFSLALDGPAANPSPAHEVHFTGTALNTASTVASVEYTIDGGASWTPVSPSDGAFDSHAEDFAIDLDLPDNVYGILLRQTGADGTQLPVADWAGIRFTIDTVAPEQVAGLAAPVIDESGSFIAHARWLPSELLSDTVTMVRYEVALDDAEVGSTYETDFEVTMPDTADHTMTVTPVDEAGNRGPSQTTSPVLDVTPPSTTATDADAGWHNTPVTVTLTSTDEIGGSGMTSGLATTEYKLDGEATWTAGESIAVDAPADHSMDGVHMISYRSTDAAGNVEATETATVKIDTTAPSTADNADALWHQSFALLLAPSDERSGVASTEYRIDGGAWTPGASATLSGAVHHRRSGLADGPHTVEYRSTDKAGNVELDESAVVRLDATAPTASPADSGGGAWCRFSDLTAANAADSDSGLAAADQLYRVDGGEWTEGSAVTVRTTRRGDHNNGLHTVDFESADRAGNSVTASVVVKLDSLGPLTANDAPTGTVTGPVTVTLTPVDAGCGVAATWHAVDGDGWNLGTSVPLTPPDAGTVTHAISYYSIDQLGNAEAFRTVAVTLAAPSPAQALNKVLVRWTPRRLARR